MTATFDIITQRAVAFQHKGQVHNAPLSVKPQPVPEWVRHSLEFTSGVGSGKIIDLSRPYGTGADVIPPKQDAFPPPTKKEEVQEVVKESLTTEEPEAPLKAKKA